MTTTLTIRPMDPEGKRARREEVRALAECVRAHSASGSWAQPDADIALGELEYHVRGMKWHIAGVLVRDLRRD